MSASAGFDAYPVRKSICRLPSPGDRPPRVEQSRATRLLPIGCC